MLPQHAPTPQGADAKFTRIGVGIDTSRYGHYAAFLRDDLQPAASDLQFVESAAGYALFRQRLEQIVARHGNVHFAIRLDAAGQYADNLLHFLHALHLDIDRFDTPGKLVAYFGVMPIEVGSGVDRDGRARAARRYVMCKRGNDLVRRYLWMAALSAIRFNPAVRALYARVVAKHPDHKAIAVGHAMRKLLHLVFAIWKTKKKFAKNHYSWDTPAHRTPLAPGGRGVGGRRRRKKNRPRASRSRQSRHGKRSPRPVSQAYPTNLSLTTAPSSTSLT